MPELHSWMNLTIFVFESPRYNFSKQFFCEQVVLKAQLGSEPLNGENALWTQIEDVIFHLH